MNRTERRARPARPAGCAGLRRAALLGVALLPLAGPAQACGYCVEDRLAAVYDHALVVRATGAGHQVAFFAIDGTPPADAAAQAALRRRLAQARGVDPGEVRLSFEPAALAVAFDPRRSNLAFVQRELERLLTGPRLTLLPLRVMVRPAELRTVSLR